MSGDGEAKETAPGRVGPEHGRRTVPERVAELEAEAEALSLRETGASYRTIARLQGVHPSTAQRRVQRALDDLVPIEKAEQVRRLEAERLDALTTRLHATLARVPVDDAHRTSTVVRELVRLSERRSRLLGLDLPAQVHLEVAHADDLDSRIAGLLSQLAGNDPTETVVETDTDGGFAPRQAWWD